MKVFGIIVILLVCTYGSFRYLLVPHVVKNNTALLDFTTLELPQSPNFYLLCEQTLCGVKANAKAPVFNVPIDTLTKKLIHLLRAKPNYRVLNQDMPSFQFTYVSYTKWMHFPDFISIQLSKLDKDKTALNIYSRSYFGYSDMGVNKKRVQSLIAQLKGTL